MSLYLQNVYFTFQLPDILPYFKSPNKVLNTCFIVLLAGLKNAPCLQIVNSLVYLAVAIRKTAKKNKLEQLDLNERLAFVLRMLEDCMGCDTLDEEKNVIRVFQNESMRNNPLNTDYTSLVCQARIFIEGPFHMCLKNKLTPVIGTRQVSIHIDKMFSGTLTTKPVATIYDIENIFQMRSNCIHYRSCPLALFALDGISKTVMLIIIGIIVIVMYDNDRYSVDTIKSTENILIVITAASLAHEIGELQTTAATDYFGVMFYLFLQILIYL